MGKSYDKFIKNRNEKELEACFERIREYLDLNGPVNAVMLAEKMDVSIGIIEQFLADRLNTEYVSKVIIISCKKCGTIIRDGRYCSDCSTNIANEVKGLFEEDRIKAYRPPVRSKKTDNEQKSDKMHYL